MGHGMEQHRVSDKRKGRLPQTMPPAKAPRTWEPDLAEMLADPVIQAMMAVDGVSRTDIVTLMSEAQERVAARSYH